jgi:hypothetical protein
VFDANAMRCGPGRPPSEQRRVAMGLRVTPEMRDKLVTRAQAKGRSITQEMELLLEQALLTEELRAHLHPPSPHGCVCPPTSEQTCKGPLCPRRSIGVGGFSPATTLL